MAYSVAERAENIFNLPRELSTRQRQKSLDSRFFKNLEITRQFAAFEKIACNTIGHSVSVTM